MNYCNFHTGLCDGHSLVTRTEYPHHSPDMRCVRHIYEAKPFKEHPLGKIMLHSV